MHLRGAWIDGTLDLFSIQFNHGLSFSRCHFSRPINLVNSKVRGVHVSQYNLHGRNGENAEIDVQLYIRSDTHSKGEFNLGGATILGDIQMCDVSIEGNGADAYLPHLWS